MAPSLSAMLQVDLSSIDAAVVLQYASKVAELQPQRHAIASEKLHMLFVLSQKLIRWLVDDRNELQKNHDDLQKQLLLVIHSARQDANSTGATAIQIESATMEQQVTQGNPVERQTASIGVDTSSLEVGIVGNSMLTHESAHDDASQNESAKDSTPSSPVSCDSTEGSDGPTEGWRVFPDDPNELYIPETDACPPEDPNAEGEDADDESVPVEKSSLPQLSSEIEVTESQSRSKNIVLAPPADPIETYLRVHKCIMRIQKVARGSLARKKFWQLVEEIMQQDEEQCETNSF